MKPYLHSGFNKNVFKAVKNTVKAADFSSFEQYAVPKLNKPISPIHPANPASPAGAKMAFVNVDTKAGLAMEPLRYGPLNKSLFTQELELLTKCLLHAPGKIKFSVTNESAHFALHAKLENIDINLSHLFKKANFSHLHFNAQDSMAFMQDQAFGEISSYHRSSWDYPYHSYTDYSSLTSAEKLAIKNYSSSAYLNINALLHDHIHTYPTYYGEENPTLKNTVLNLTLLASGLNKIMPEIVLNEHHSYRGEHAISQDEITTRIHLAENGGGYTCENAYMSTSISYYIANSFKGKSMIIFDSVYGKDISGLSYFPSEKEYLLLPSKILWENHSRENNNDVFHAKVIVPLVEGEDVVSAQELSIFNELYHWAKNHGIKTDFLTSDVLDRVKTTPPLKIHDFLSLEQDTILGLDNHHSSPTYNESATPAPTLEMLFVSTALDSMAIPVAIEVI